VSRPGGGDPPAVVVVTDRALAAAADHGLDEVVAAALEGGARGVLLRDKDLEPDARAGLAARLRDLTAAHGAELWVASTVGLARAAAADGVHLAAADPFPRDARGLRVGRSCHTVDDLLHARAEGADRATYSPVFATGSKPGYGPALGVDGLSDGCQAVPDLAVVALGGIGPGRAGACVGAGAWGVALMGGVMRAPDPRSVVRAVAEEVSAVHAVDVARRTGG
jgi:thiamine-phosphate diphosphorylase